VHIVSTARAPAHLPLEVILEGRSRIEIEVLQPQPCTLTDEIRRFSIGPQDLVLLEGPEVLNHPGVNPGVPVRILVEAAEEIITRRAELERQWRKRVGLPLDGIPDEGLALADSREQATHIVEGHTS
jgi:hypothetical protein